MHTHMHTHTHIHTHTHAHTYTLHAHTHAHAHTHTHTATPTAGCNGGAAKVWGRAEGEVLSALQSQDRCLQCRELLQAQRYSSPVCGGGEDNCTLVHSNFDSFLSSIFPFLHLDKSAGGKFSNEFEEASQKLQDYCECLGIEVNERINILEMLRECQDYLNLRLSDFQNTTKVGMDLFELCELGARTLASAPQTQ